MKIIAHRGYSAKYPENTMIAFEKAIACGADMIELDITFSKDQHIVVIHDQTLDRTTLLKGAVDQYSLKDLKKTSAGMWFADSFGDQTIPTLSEVLHQFGKDIEINIEIKKEAVLLNVDQSIEKPLVTLLESFSTLSGIQISSFEPLALHRLRKMMPKARLCYTTKASPSKEMLDEMRYLDIAQQHICIADVTQKDVEHARAMGWTIAAYTVNAEEDFLKAQSLGLDAIFTDELERVKGWSKT